ncbi:hypothetical protein ACTVZO_37935 [Streptomyces sp. IBSNAI002]|uniref:hypothetical protein n=1 Tax=Streptomyces sp. IBSNAI002 TaxID=3457500 RepID=UPI003FD47F85
MERRSEGSEAWEADEDAEPPADPAEGSGALENYRRHLAAPESVEGPEGLESNEAQAPLDDTGRFHREMTRREQLLREDMKTVVVAAGGTAGREAGEPEQDGEDRRTAEERFADAYGVRLVGLDHAVKTEESLRRKVAGYQAEGMSEQDALKRIKDAIRYTVQLPDDQYVAGSLRAIGALTALGHEEQGVRNSWKDSEYRGVNTSWRASGTDTRFEVQFHTEVPPLCGSG